MRTRPVTRVVTATEAKNRFGDMIKGAYLRDEHLIVKRDGIPVVAIVPIADYQRAFDLQDMPSQTAEGAVHQEPSKAELDRMSLSEFLRVVHERIGEVDTEEAERDILEAVQEVRALRHADSDNA